MEAIKHQGSASFNPDTTYQVFRNVKDFGAKGDGGELVNIWDDLTTFHAKCTPSD